MRRRFFRAICSAGAWLAGVSPAFAGPQECIAANERGSTFKARGEFSAARSEYLACAAETCPKVIRDECASLISALDGAASTVVLVALDGQGNDAIGVRVFVDGHAHAAGVDGRAFPIDPGEHEFRFELGSAVREVRAVVREGEKNRSIRIQFDEQAHVESARGLVAPEPAELSAGRPIPALSYVLAATGVVALGSFTYFALRGHSQQSDLEQRCAPNCPVDDARSMAAKYLAADVSLAVAAVSLGGATYFYVTRPPAPDRAAATRTLPIGDGVQLNLYGRF
ncbi:MAG: hypothetical protein QM756_09570 [Polyangiaceae bacterium]